MIEVYLDESHQLEGRICVFAGYMANHEIWNVDFCPRWSRMLNAWGLPEFHAAEINYAPIRGLLRRDQRDDIFKAAVDILVSTDNGLSINGYGMAVVFPPKHLLPPHIQSQADMETRGYYMACYSLIEEIVRFAAPLCKSNNIEFHIITDNKIGMNHAATNGLEQALQEARRQIPSLTIRITSGGDSKQMLPLQAADLFAYEIGKEVVRRLRGCQLDARIPIKRLIASPHYHEAMVFDLEAVDAFRRGKAAPPPMLFARGQAVHPKLTWGVPVGFDYTLAETESMVLPPRCGSSESR